MADTIRWTKGFPVVTLTAKSVHSAELKLMRLAERLEVPAYYMYKSQVVATNPKSGWVTVEFKMLIGPDDHSVEKYGEVDRTIK